MNYNKYFKIMCMSAAVVTAATGCASNTSADISVSSSETFGKEEGSLSYDDMFTDTDFDSSYDENTAEKITLSDKSVFITKGGTYILSGNLAEGQITVDTDDEVHLVFNGVNINCDSGAALYVKNAKKVYVTFAEGSENTLSNTENFAPENEKIDAVIYSKDDIAFNGNGSLTINALSGHAIAANDNLVITGGKYTINSAKKGISANDSIRIANGDFTITSSADGIHAENTEDETLGFVYIADGTFNITSEQDGISASGILQTDGGEFNITTGGGYENSQKKHEETPPMGEGHFGRGNGERPQKPNNGSQSADVKDNRQTADGNTGEPPQMPEGENLPENNGEKPETPSNTENSSEPDKNADSSASADNTSSDEETTVSQKAVKAEGKIIINDGSFNINSCDDSVHSNSDVSVIGGTFTLSSGDDGFHADETLKIDGAEIAIDTCYEGLEGHFVEIADGNITINSTDDGINSAGGNDQSGFGGPIGKDNFTETEDTPKITISGGTINIKADGDGIDSNGSVYISGGETYVYCSHGGDSAIDYDGKGVITGGTFAGWGISGMEENFSTDSTQCAAMITLDRNATGEFVLKNSDGNEVFSFTPEEEYGYVMISTPDMNKGESYTLSVGENDTEFEMSDIVYSNTQRTGGGMHGTMGGKRPDEAVNNEKNTSQEN